MYTVFVVVLLIAAVCAITNPPITGTTPPAVDCPPSLCSGKDDGNYAYDNYGIKKDNYFVQCVAGKAYCQACFPLSLKFKQECNQCMYSLSDPCYTTAAWVAVPTFKCPDNCPAKGPDFSGNIADHHQPKHYIGCWNGMTMGCVRCPGVLLFNEAENACLYEGKYLTEPLQHQGHKKAH